MIQLKNSRRPAYNKLKAFFAENGIRHADVAQELGKSPSAFSQNISGNGGDLSLDDARKICALYGVSMDEMFMF